MPQNDAIIYCNCTHYQRIPEDTRSAVRDTLSRADVEIHAVDDLCGLCAKKDRRLKGWLSADSVKIIACFPRTVRWLLHAAGISLDGADAEIFNMRNTPPEQIIAIINRQGGGIAAQHHIDLEPGDDWIPWFPVIDYDRCINCKQCFNFCLFGTYKLDENDGVVVANPSGCKTNCPACARMCPQQAIIFPKYESGPINGDEVPDEKEKTAVDAQELTAGDPMAALRNRSKQCPTIENLQKQLDIPADVIASLSADDMRRIAEKKGKARADR
jgi:NAD-dependent dihydropyrimidine dehydrogenase PreA subunit